jgi:3-dehydroquinate synthase
VTGYAPLLHGEAVAFGMVVESRIAARRGWLPEPALERLIGLLQSCGLPVDARDLPADVTGRALIDATTKVRLIRAGSLRWVLPTDLGATVIADDVADGEIRAALADCGILG